MTKGFFFIWMIYKRWIKMLNRNSWFLISSTWQTYTFSHLHTTNGAHIGTTWKMSHVVACWFWEWVQRPQENVAFWRWRKWKKYCQLISLYVSINHPEWFISDPDLIQLRLFRVLDTDSAPFRKL